MQLPIMRRLAFTTLLTISGMLCGCYQRTVAPEVLAIESDVEAFRQDMGIVAEPMGEGADERASESLPDRTDSVEPQ